MRQISSPQWRKGHGSFQEGNSVFRDDKAEPSSKYY